jgi:hypothetical protein
MLAAFGPASNETAIFLILGVIAFIIAALTSVTETRAEARGGAFVGWQFLVALGLALVFFPTMWQTMDAAF